MFRSFARLVALLFLATVLAACGSRPKPAPDVMQVFDIRSVTVTANEGISARMLAQIDNHLERAIAATIRPVPMPAADMTVRVVSVSRGVGLDQGHARAEVSVVLSDIGTRQTILVRNYLVLAFSEQGKVSAATVADTIAARLRSEFSLATPQITRRVSTAPAISTVIGDDNTEKPKIIPLSTAPVVGVDQDPMLNSKTRVEPAAAVPAKVEPAMKAADPAVEKVTTEPKSTEEKAAKPEAHPVEEGANAKVVIKPATAEPAKEAPADAAPADDEICVETLEKKC